MTQRNPNLFADAVKIISQCIEHLHDDDLSQDELKSREILFEYYRLLMRRRSSPNYGKFKYRKPRGGHHG